MESLVLARWIDRSPDASRRLDRPEPPAAFRRRILASRGVPAGEEAAFLHPLQQEPPDPWRVPGMRPAAERLAAAVRANGTIAVHGDYDADGLTATALLVRLLASLGAPVFPVVPDRMTEGYGLSPATLQRIRDGEASLVVTVDCGVSCVPEVAALKREGRTVIVTDHHDAPPVLPEADALVDPRLPGTDPRDAVLSGVGVAWLLGAGLLLLLGRDLAPVMDLMDLAAVGTVADICPVSGLNRWILAMGLDRLARSPNPGLKALLQVARGQPASADETTLAFLLAPRLNAAGRIGDATRALALLLTEDPSEAAVLAGCLEEDNRNRQAIEGTVLAEALPLAERAWDPGRPGFLVVSGAGWHPGVVGIVAARLAERLIRPTLVLAEETDEAGRRICRGSARSAGGVDILPVIRDAADLLVHYGGHRKAAGLTVPAEALPALAQRLDAGIRARVRLEELSPTRWVDFRVPASMATLGHAAAIAALAPFGEGHEPPALVTEGVRIRSVRLLSDGRHAKVSLESDGGETLSAIGFQMGGRCSVLRPGDRVDLLYCLETNSWNGRTEAQLRLLDIRPAGLEPEDAIRAVPEPPDPDQVRILYPVLAARCAGGCHLDWSLAAFALSREAGIDLTPGQLLAIARILSEAGLATLAECDDGRALLTVPPAAPSPRETRPDLRRTPTWQALLG